MDWIQPQALVSGPGHQVKIGVCSFVPRELGQWSKQLPCLTERLRGFQQQRTSNSACSFKIRQNVLLQKNILFFISVFYKWLIKMLRGTGILPMFFPWGSLHPCWLPGLLQAVYPLLSTPFTWVSLPMEREQTGSCATGPPPPWSVFTHHK